MPDDFCFHLWMHMALHASGIGLGFAESSALAQWAVCTLGLIFVLFSNHTRDPQISRTRSYLEWFHCVAPTYFMTLALNDGNSSLAWYISIYYWLTYPCLITYACTVGRERPPPLVQVVVEQVEERAPTLDGPTTRERTEELFDKMQMLSHQLDTGEVEDWTLACISAINAVDEMGRLSVEHRKQLAHVMTEVIHKIVKVRGPSILMSEQLCKVETLVSVDECSICLTPMDRGTHKLRNCGHTFHDKCIFGWATIHHTCPICRAPV